MNARLTGSGDVTFGVAAGISAADGRTVSGFVSLTGSATGTIGSATGGETESVAGDFDALAATTSWGGVFGLIAFACAGLPSGFVITARGGRENGLAMDGSTYGKGKDASQ